MVNYDADRDVGQGGLELRCKSLVIGDAAVSHHIDRYLASSGVIEETVNLHHMLLT